MHENTIVVMDFKYRCVKWDIMICEELLSLQGY